MALKFRERPARAIIFVATIRPSAAPPSHTVERGDNIQLYVDDSTVFVTVEQRLDAQRYTGKVMGVKASAGKTYQGLDTGAIIEFSEKNIFTCSKASAR
jgi:hypothetical protein